MEKLIRHLLDFIKTDCPRVAHMESPLTEEQAAKLLKLFPLVDIKKQFQKLENYKPLLKNYTSAYLTCRKWFEIDQQKGLR
jgi:hypothetical protein